MDGWNLTASDRENYVKSVLIERRVLDAPFLSYQDAQPRNGPSPGGILHGALIDVCNPRHIARYVDLGLRDAPLVSLDARVKFLDEIYQGRRAIKSHTVVVGV